MSNHSLQTLPPEVKRTILLKYEGCDHAIALDALDRRRSLLRAAVGKTTTEVCGGCGRTCTVTVVSEDLDKKGGGENRLSHRLQHGTDFFSYLAIYAEEYMWLREGLLEVLSQLGEPDWAKASPTLWLVPRLTALLGEGEPVEEAPDER